MKYFFIQLVDINIIRELSYKIHSSHPYLSKLFFRVPKHIFTLKVHTLTLTYVYLCYTLYISVKYMARRVELTFGHTPTV